MKAGEVKTVTLRLEPDGDADEEGYPIDCSYYVPDTKEDEKHECVDCKDNRGEYMGDVPDELQKKSSPYHVEKFTVQTTVLPINGELLCLCKNHVVFRCLENKSKYTPEKLGYKVQEMITKGDWVYAEWMVPIGGCVSGSQTKFTMKEMQVSGIVRHIRGDRPVNPTSVRLFVEPDGQSGGEVLVDPSWVKRHEKRP